MAEIYPSRTKTYNPLDQVASADLNAIQDGIIGVSDAIGDKAKTIRIVPWGDGLPTQVNGVPTVPTLDHVIAAPMGVRAADLAANSFYYSLEDKIQLNVETIDKIRIYFARSDAAAVLQLLLIREAISGGAQTTVSTLPVSDSAVSWVMEESGSLAEAYDPDTYIYYLRMTINCNAAVADVAVRMIEVDVVLD